MKFEELNKNNFGGSEKKEKRNDPIEEIKIPKIFFKIKNTITEKKNNTKNGNFRRGKR